MDLQSLERFLALWEYRHFGKAAQSLRVTQPALTQSIQALERDLDVRLFERNARAVIPTAAGQQLFEHARLILADVKNARASIAKGGFYRGQSIRLGASEHLCSGFFPRLINQHLQSTPNVVVNVTFSNNTQLVSKLQAGELDVAVISGVPVRDTKGLRLHPFAPSVWHVTCRTGHPLASVGQLSRAEMSRWPWALYDQKATIDAFLRNFERLKLPIPTYRIVSGSYEFLKNMLVKSEMLSILEWSTIEDDVNARRLRVLQSDSNPANYESFVMVRDEAVLPAWIAEFVDYLCHPAEAADET